MLAKVEETGVIRVPMKLASELGLEAGAEVHIQRSSQGLTISRPVTHLARLYVEPTNECNLSCKACIRHAWMDTPCGFMEWELFEMILEEASTLPFRPSIFLGGYGEPLLHPLLVRMIDSAKAKGFAVELITNGTLLDREMSAGLIQAGLDRLWISLDGIAQEVYGPMRSEAPVDLVLENMRRFRDLATGFKTFALPKPALGLVFVATKKNLGELPKVVSLGMRLGVTEIVVTNVLPHTKEMFRDILFESCLNEFAFEDSIFRLLLPRMDVSALWDASRVLPVLRSGFSVEVAGGPLWRARDLCPFVDRGAFVVGWQGNTAPCLPLLYTHSEILHGIFRTVKNYVTGNVREQGLMAAWFSEEHIAFRKRVKEFAFSPCSICGGCDLLESNEEDCFGNTHPTCGACLFSQGVVRCP